MKRKSALLATVSALAVLTGCASNTYVAPRISEDEAYRANQAQAANKRLPEYNRTDEQNKQMIGKVFNRLVTSSRPICADAGVDCSKFKIAYDPSKQVNAFASNGQNITISAGLMRYVDEPQLAVAMAHEMGHHLAKHNQKTQQRASTGATLGALAGALLAKAAGADPKLGASIGMQGGMIGAVVSYSKEQEKEADYVGGYIASAAGYNLQEGGKVWTTLGVLGGNKATSGLLATHPTGAERDAAWQHTVHEVQTNPTRLPRKVGSNPAP